ncbi:MAG: roadblock/LC7 domain-containing protein [Candidatus Thorarchaeota archaeon]
MNDSPSDKFREVSQIINEIKDEANLEGIIFATRDGELISENIGDELNSKKIASMCATVLESAVGIGDSIGNQKIKKIIAELEEKTIFILDCDRSTFFIIIINRESHISSLMSKLEEVIQKVNKM